MPEQKPSLANLNYFRNLFLNFIILSVILLATMGITIWFDVVSKGKGSVSQPLITLVVSTALFTSLTFTLGYSLVKAPLSFIVNLVNKFILPQNPLLTTPTPNTQQRILDLFFMTAAIIIFVPVRPVLQDIVITSNDFYLTQRFVKFDFAPTFFILLFLAVVAYILLFLFKGSSKNLMVYLLPVPIAIGLSFFAYGSNFPARISETRAAWKESNWTKLLEKANGALEAAKTNEEKAVSYYWIGVAYNLQEKPKQAVDSQLKSIELDPNSGYQYSNLSFGYIRLKDYKKATQAANKCIELSPAYPWCHMALARIDWENRQYGESQKEVERALQLDPESREIRSTLEETKKIRAQYGI